MFCVSVPVKSNVGHLATALASLCAQEAPCAVALLDASGDPAVPAIADASGLDFAWRRHGPDAGQSAAIAEGWRESRGDILGWLNDDDQLIPGALSVVAEIFAAEPETDIVYGHGVMLDEAGAFTGYFPSISADPAGLRSSNVICQPACFVRRRAVEAIGGIDPSLHFVMDWDLWLRLYEAGARFRFIDRPLAAVRSHAATKTRSGGIARWREVERLMAPRLSARGVLRLRLGMALTEARDNGHRSRMWALDAFFRIGRLGRPARELEPAILGLGRIGNRVEMACTIVCPVRVTDTHVDLCIVVDRQLELTAKASGSQIRGVRVSRKDDKRFVYRLPEVPVSGGLLSCEIAAEDSEWRLFRAFAAPASGARVQMSESA